MALTIIKGKTQSERKTETKKNEKGLVPSQ